MIDEYDYHPDKKLPREVVVDGKRKTKLIGPNTRLQEIVAALAETTRRSGIGKDADREVPGRQGGR